MSDWKSRRMRAKQILSELRNLLGNHCARCGCEDGLEFDCIVPKGHAHHATETNRRAYFYRREFKAGNLQLLCKDPCHLEKSRKEQYWQQARMETERIQNGQPF